MKKKTKTNIPLCQGNGKGPLLLSFLTFSINQSTGEKFKQANTELMDVQHDRQQIGNYTCPDQKDLHNTRLRNENTLEWSYQTDEQTDKCYQIIVN